MGRVRTLVFTHKLVFVPTQPKYGGDSMDINWYLLAIAILAKENVSVEGAENLWWTGKINLNQQLHQADEIARLNQAGVSQREIGKMLGISRTAVNQRLVRWRRQIERMGKQ